MKTELHPPQYCDDLDTYLKLTIAGGPLLALAVASKLLPISKTRLYYLARHNKIQTVRVFGQYHVHASTLERWLKT